MPLTFRLPPFACTFAAKKDHNSAFNNNAQIQYNAVSSPHNLTPPFKCSLILTQL